MARRKLYRFPLYALARAVAACIYLIPRSLALKLARGLGRLSYFLVGRHRKRTLENLRCAYGNEISGADLERLAQKVFEHAAQTAIEVLQFPKWSRETSLPFVDAGNAFEIYENLLREGNGVISVTAHLGNWELLAGVFGLAGFKGKVLARKIYYEPYNRWIVGLRAALKVPTLYRDESAREIFDLLKQNHIIGLLPDQDMDSLKGIFVPFFGRPAYTPVAPVKVALATGAPIVSNFLVRQPGDRYRLVVADVIRPRVETTREAAVEKYTEVWMKSFERMIREYPEQWAWMHNRWKTKPEDLYSTEQTFSGQSKR